MPTPRVHWICLVQGLRLTQVRLESLQLLKVRSPCIGGGFHDGYPVWIASPLCEGLISCHTPPRGHQPTLPPSVEVRDLGVKEYATATELRLNI